MNTSSWFWAAKMLKGRQRSTAVKKHIRSALLGITFSMIPLVIVIILANGMIDGITRRIIAIDSGIAKAYQLREHAPQEIEQLRSRITDELGFDTQLLYEGNGVLFSHDDNRLVTVRGVDHDAYQLRQLELHEGSRELSGQQVMISPQLADQLGIGIDDRVTLLTFVEQNGTIRYKPTLMNVAGIASSGYHMLDQGMVYVPKDAGGRLFTNIDAQVLRLLPREGDLRGTVGSVARGDVEEILGAGWFVLPWEQQYAGVYQNYQSTKVLLYMIMALIVIAAGVHIASCSHMIILENTEAIGILRSMGVGMGRIRFSFIITGMTIGFIGSLIGIGIGLAVGSQINHVLQFLRIQELQAMEFYLASIEIHIPVLEIIAVFGYGLLVSGISSVVPTRQLKRMSPLKIITSS